MGRAKKGTVTWKMIFEEFKSHFPNLRKKATCYRPHSYATILICLSDNTDILYNYDTKEINVM